MLSLKQNNISIHVKLSCASGYPTSPAVLPAVASSSSRLAHSFLKQLAPVRLPSPPIHTRLLMPRLTRFLAALSLPSRVRNSLHRAVPIMVPPCIDVHTYSSGNEYGTSRATEIEQQKQRAGRLNSDWLEVRNSYASSVSYSWPILLLDSQHLITAYNMTRFYHWTLTFGTRTVKLTELTLGLF